MSGSTPTRRQFMETASVLTAAAALSNTAHAADSNTLRLGLVGCGGRGSGALGNARPMMVSPQHRFRVSGPALVAATGRSEAFLRARFLPGLPGMGARAVRRCGGVTYVHVLLDRHAVIFADGAATEPLWPGPQALRSLMPGERAEIFALFPDLAPLLALPGPLARDRVARAYAPLARPDLTRRDLRGLCDALSARAPGRAA